MKKSNFKINLIIPLLCTILLLSCKDDDPIDDPRIDLKNQSDLKNESIKIIDEITQTFLVNKTVFEQLRQPERRQSENEGARISGICDLDTVIFYVKSPGTCESRQVEGHISCQVVTTILDKIPDFKKPSAKYGGVDIPEDAIQSLRYEQRGESSFISYAFSLKGDGYPLPPQLKGKYDFDIIYVNYTDPDDFMCNSPLLDTIVNYVANHDDSVYDSTRYVADSQISGWIELFGEKLGTSFQVEGYSVKDGKVPHWEGFSPIFEYGEKSVKGYKDTFSQQLNLSSTNQQITIKRDWWEFIDMEGVIQENTGLGPTGFSIKEQVFIDDDRYVKETIDPIYNTYECDYSLSSVQEGYNDALFDGTKAENGKIKWSKTNVSNLDTAFVIYDKGVNYGSCETDSLFSLSIRSTSDGIDTLFQANRYK